MEIPLLDISRLDQPLVPELEAALRRVVASGRYIAGQAVAEFERDLASWLGAPFVVCTSSGPDALLVALKALGVGAGHGVLVPAVASAPVAHVVALAGARPVFVDVEPRTFTLDPARLGRALRFSSGLRALIVEHLFGQPAMLEEIRRVNLKQRLPLIEVAFQALGTTVSEKAAGTVGEVGCFSFHPSSNLGAIGDGGALATADEALAAKFRVFADYGRSGRHQYSEVGLSARMHDLQAAFLWTKLRYLSEWNASRISAADYYRGRIIQRGLAAVFKPPLELERGRAVLNHFVCSASRRDEMLQFLSGRGIAADPLIPLPLHLEGCYRRVGYRPGDYPVAEAVIRSFVALPFHQAITRTEQDNVIEAVSIFFSRRGKQAT